MDNAQRARLYQNTAESMVGVPGAIIDRALDHYNQITPEYAAGIRSALDALQPAGIAAE